MLKSLIHAVAAAAIVTVLSGCKSTPQQPHKPSPVELGHQAPWPARASTPLIYTGAIGYLATN